jgi:hypothetical protein
VNLATQKNFEKNQCRDHQGAIITYSHISIMVTEVNYVARLHSFHPMTTKLQVKLRQLWYGAKSFFRPNFSAKKRTLVFDSFISTSIPVE